MWTHVLYAFKYYSSTSKVGHTLPTFTSKRCLLSTYFFTTRPAQKAIHIILFVWIHGWRGASNESGIVENGDFRFFRSLSSEHFTYMATRQFSRDATVDDLGDISRSLDCFTSNFSRTVCDTAKVTTDY